MLTSESKGEILKLMKHVLRCHSVHGMKALKDLIDQPFRNRRKGSKTHKEPRCGLKHCGVKRGNPFSNTVDSPFAESPRVRKRESKEHELLVSNGVCHQSSMLK